MSMFAESPNSGMKITITEARLHPSAELGFTIAEICISLLLVVTLFVGLYAGIASGFTYTKALRENLRATQIMLERLEGIRLYNWSQLNSNSFLPGTFTESYYPQIDGTNANPGLVYTGSVSVASVSLFPPATYSPDMRLVTVRVGWLTSYGRSNVHVRQRSMSTYVGRNGMQNYIFNN